MKYQVYLALLGSISGYRLKQSMNVGYRVVDEYYTPEPINDQFGLINGEDPEPADIRSFTVGNNEGVPVLVNPVVLPNTEGDTHLGLNMRVGGDAVSVAKTNQQKMEQTINMAER